MGTNFEIYKLMPRSIPNFKEQVHFEDIYKTLEENYSSIGSIWMPLQLEWINGIYQAFKDYEKFMIIAHLLSRTFEFYSKNFVRLTYDEFYDQKQIEIEKYNIMDIAKNLDIPKETARRKIKELEEIGHIKRFNKKIVVDNGTWPNVQPRNTIKRISRFFATFSKILCEKKILLKTFSTEEITKIIKEYFSHVWKLYYDMQIPMLLNNKKMHGDLETFHVWGVCIVNQVINSNRNDNSRMSKEYYLDKFIFQGHEDSRGVNAMSISDISGIPRATVIRKLNSLVKNNFLKMDKKKLYVSTGFHKKKKIITQNENFINLSKFASNIYNLNIYQNFK